MRRLDKLKVATLCALLSVVLIGCVGTSKPKTMSVTSDLSGSASSRTNSSSEKLQNASQQQAVRIGPYEIFSPKALSVLNTKAPITTLATGFKWVEGPVWSEQHQALFFSDIPNHKIYRHTENEGLTEFLAHSGYSNGLLINKNDEMLIMQSRLRQVAKLRQTISQHLATQSMAKESASSPLSIGEASSFRPDDYLVLVDNYQGNKLNSPNDGVLSSKGILYFTDPPYGLPKKLDDPGKELDFQAVYALSPSGKLTILDKSLVYPNGIALSNDEKSLYVAASNANKPAWYRYVLDNKGGVANREVFYEAPVQGDSSHGLPDGLKVHKSGIIFATGPDGIWLFDESGALLAKVHMPSISANLAFDVSHERVFVTAHHQLLSFSLRP